MSCGLRYVVLRHEGIADPHFDLMFETVSGSVLATWRSADWPIVTPTPLQKLPDHRAFYLEYEGPIRGNRGSVRRIAAGYFELIEQNTAQFHAHFKPPDQPDLLFTCKDDQWAAIPSPKA